MRRRSSVYLVWLCLPTLAVSAHDIPNARIDRSIQVSLEPGRLEIDYEVSLSELTLTQDLRMLTGSLPGTDRRDWFGYYGREVGPLNGRGLLVTLQARPLPLRYAGFELTVADHPRFVFHYEAALPAGGHIEVQDINYAGSDGTSRLAVRGRGGVIVRGDALPSDVESVAIRPVWQLSDVEERRTKHVAFDYTCTAALASPRLPGSTAKEPAGTPLPTQTQRSAARPVAPGLGSARLTALLDRTAALPTLGLLLMAMGLGAVHSLQPGHGKTLVAATVLGERGTWARGVLLGLVTTLTHTASVLLVALGLWWTRTERYGEIQSGLAHLAGGVIAAIGLWRLGRHLARHGEHDAFVPGSSDAGAARPDRGLVGLGVAGGLVPCWDAIVLLLLAEAIGRLVLGVVLVLAFGFGMAVVLVAVGVLAGRIRRHVLGGPGPAVYGPWDRGLGIASGLTLAVIGVYLLGLD